MKKKKDSNKNDIYEECLSTLNHEISHHKIENFKKETRKIKMEHFLSYFNSCDNSFLNTPLQFLWNLNYLTEKFLEDISNYEYDKIIPLVIQILIGDFKGAEKKNKFMKINKSNLKLCSFYLLKLNEKPNDNIFFCLCLEKDDSLQTAIYFLSISHNWDFEEIGREFYEKIFNDDSKYPIVEFDKCGLLSEEILFSHKNIDNDTGRTICYPLKNITQISNIIFSIEVIHKKKILIYNNSKDFENNELNESIIKQIEDNQYDKRIINLIEGKDNCWNYKLSTQEKNYIKDSESIILSGRAGTGKTTVILFKLFSIYFNYKLKKKERINFNHNINTNNKKITDSLRVVFTSLSQFLCET